MTITEEEKGLKTPAGSSGGTAATQQAARGLGGAARSTERRATDNGNPGTLVGTENREGVRYARFRAKQGTWVSSSLAQLGYDKEYGRDSAYGAYLGIAKAPDGRPLENPDKIKPGQEYLIPVGTVGKIEGPPPASKELPPNGVPPNPGGYRGTEPIRPPAQSNVNLRSGKWSARLIPTPPREIVAPDPTATGILGETVIPNVVRQAILGFDPIFVWWLLFTLEELVKNFLINLKLELNDPLVLRANGMTFPGQSNKDKGDVLQNGSEMNAFRHTFGQAVITQKWGRNHAVAVGAAHENITVDTTKRSFTNRAVPSNALFEADTVADQLNNEIGRRIAESLGSKASTRDIAAEVLRTFRDDGLYVATFRGKGEVTIVRRPIPEQQFQFHMWLLKSLNDEGRLALPTPYTNPRR
ncbi:hypothetical protein Q2941_17480 [Bradyrhizobium sp. UFLA05-153]